MSRRARLLLAGLAAIAVVVVLVVVLSAGGDDPKGETVRGMPERGFPLRGSLAADDDAIDDAVSAWRKSVKENADSEAARDTPGSGPRDDDDVTVLWIGHAGDDDKAILEGGSFVAEMQRGNPRGWYVSGTSPRDYDETEHVPIGAGDSVLVPDTGGDWRFVSAGYDEGLELAEGGLFTGSGSRAEGFVLPDAPGGPSGDDRLVSMYVTGGGNGDGDGIGGRTITGSALARLTRAIDHGDARAVWLAGVEGQRALAAQADPDRGRFEAAKPQPLEVVWTGAVPRHGPAAVVAQGDANTRTLSFAYGKTPGPEDRSEDADDGSLLLGAGADDISGHTDEDTAVAGNYLEIEGAPYLVLAGTGVKTLHALIAGEEVSRAAPVAIVDVATFFADNHPGTVIFGRTADGQVVSPLAVP